jgi:hypothetical protein
MSKRDRGVRSEKPWERMIQERQEHLEAVLDALTQKSADVELSPAMKRDVAVATLNLHRMVSKYTDENVLETGDLPDVSSIRERLGQTTKVNQQSPGLKRGTRQATRPAIDELGFDYLQDVANQTEQAAKQLGFWASMSASPSGGSRLPNPNNLTAEPPALDGETSSVSREAAEFEQSHFFRSLYQDIEGNRGGGAIVIVDAEDARTGVGKTGAACGMAEFVSWYFGYDIQDRDGVLSGQEYLDLFKKHPNEEQVSVCVWDEAVGAGSGDARRSMAQENVDLGRAWQLMRDRKVITFVTLPDWGDLDSRLQKLADYRVWCRRDIGSMQAYEIGTTFEGGDIRTRGLGPGEGAEPVAFPDVTDDSDLYQAIKEKKNKVQESDSLDAGELREEEADDGTDSDDSGPDLHNIAEQVADNHEDFTSIHGGNGTEYIDSDLIELEFDLSIRKAEKVKKLAERQVGEI